MKKLITLLLVLTGMVSTASAKTIYLENNWSKSNIWVGVGNTEKDSEMTWTKLLFLGNSTNDYYIIDLGTYSKFRLTYTNSGDGNSGTAFLSSSSFTDGSVYKFLWDGGSSTTILESATAVTVYTHNLSITTATDWSHFYIWAWNGSTNLWNTAWPGQEITGESNAYSYTIKSLYSSINVLFNQGNEQPKTCDLVANAGDNSYYIASVGSDSNVGESVKTNAYGYATHVSTNPLTIPSGIAFYATDNGDGSATAAALTNPAASTPMFIKGNASTTYHFAATASGTAPSGNAFKAGAGSALASTTDGKYNYILNGNSLKAANGQTVGTKKAYLQLSAQATASRILIFDDDATGISDVKSQKTDATGEYFNLSGQRVAQPTKGLYIVNGKKVIIK